MSGRRAANNRIRGPQSALTDFLASNNISAFQIHADYERRQAEARQREAQEAAERGETIENEDQDASEDDEERVTAATNKKKRKREQEKTLAKIKASKKGKGQKKRKNRPSDSENDDDVDAEWAMYEKKKPLPGQLENCEICDKRFTVTPYSKTGPGGGLLCTKCSKEQEAGKKKDEKGKKQSVGRDKRRQVQSNLLDGIVQIGAKPLQELCVKEVANNIHDVDDFGDLPDSLLKRLSQILSRRRVITSRTLNLFLRSDLTTIDIYDCGRLEVEDYIHLFSIVPKVQKLNLRNAGQFKDEVLDYIIERDIPIKHLELGAANLVSNEKWVEYFEKCGHRLETLKLAWLDYSMDEDTFTKAMQCCPNLKRLKLRKAFKLADVALSAMAQLTKLEHLTLQLNLPVDVENLAQLIISVGPNLLTLSLQNFQDADDNVLHTIHSHCTKLRKLRFTENDCCTDAGFVTLFSCWSNSPLPFIDLSSNRSMDYSQPDGPDDPVGLASAGLEAVMAHSGSAVERLDISSCRHIAYDSFSQIFNGLTEYPFLKDINISFLTKVDTAIVVGMFKSCPQLVKVTAFGCFNVTDVAVPKGVALIGLPNAQDSIVKEGDVDADEWMKSVL